MVNVAISTLDLTESRGRSPDPGWRGQIDTPDPNTDHHHPTTTAQTYEQRILWRFSKATRGTVSLSRLRRPHPQAGKWDVAVVEAQTPATTSKGPIKDQPSLHFSSQAAALPGTPVQHSSYVWGSIEGIELNILIDSGSSESFITAD